MPHANALLLASFCQELIHTESSINDIKHVSIHADMPLLTDLILLTIFLATCDQISNK